MRNKLLWLSAITFLCYGFIYCLINGCSNSNFDIHSSKPNAFIFKEENNPDSILFQMHQEIDTILFDDLNSDGSQDSALIYSPFFAFDSPDGSTIGGCQDDSCLTQVKFSFTDEILFHSTALGFQTFFSVGDLNSDGIAELAFIPNWFQSCWQGLFVYSLNKDAWEMIGQCNVYACSDEDFSKRIKKVNNHTFEMICDVMSPDSEEKSVKTIEW